MWPRAQALLLSLVYTCTAARGQVTAHVAAEVPPLQGVPAGAGVPVGVGVPVGAPPVLPGCFNDNLVCSPPLVAN